MAEEGLKYGFKILLGVIFGIYAVVFIGFLIPSIYFTVLNPGIFSYLWIGCILTFIFAFLTALVLYLCSINVLNHHTAEH